MGKKSLGSSESAHSKEEIEIIGRFYEVLDYLLETKKVKSYYDFAIKYDIPRNSLTVLKAEPTRNLFRARWVTILLRDFNVSADYIFLGEGDMFYQ
jgi:hypothetical protein